MTHFGRVDRSRTVSPDLQPEVADVRRGSLRLGSDELSAAPSSQHLAPQPFLGGQLGQVAQQPQVVDRSLRNRTVPRQQALGGLTGALTGMLGASLGAGAVGGTLVAMGEGAALGAAFGSIIPGAGTVVGAIVGCVAGGLLSAGVGGAVGALIGRLKAGGSRRDRAEKLIIGLVNERKIKAPEASRLKGMSNSELKALTSISRRRTGIATKADRDDIRRAVLLTAAKQGPDEALRLKAELLNLKPPTEAGQRSLAAIGARNRIALQPHLSASQDPRFAGMSGNQLRLGEYQRFMQDAVAQETRNGNLVTDMQLGALSTQALKHIGKFQDDDALREYQARRRDFEAEALSLMQLAAGPPRPEQLAGKVLDLRQSLEAMWAAKDPDGEPGSVELYADLEAAFARAAGGSPTPGVARKALNRIVAANSALRTVHDAGTDIRDNLDLHRTFNSQGGLVASTVFAIMATIPPVLGEPTNTISTTFLDLPNPSQATKQPVIRALASRIHNITAPQIRARIDDASLDDALHGDDYWITEKFDTWSTEVNFCSESVEISKEIGGVLEMTGDGFRQAFDGLSHRLTTDGSLNISHDQKQQLAKLDLGSAQFEADAKGLLVTIRSEFRSRIDMSAFKDWLKASEGLN